MRDMILVLGVDMDDARGLARKLRGEGFYCRLVPRDISAQQVQTLNPSGLILAGGALGQVQGEALDPLLLDLGMPVLAMGGCAAWVNATMGGGSGETLRVEEALPITFDGESPFFSGLEPLERWFGQKQRWQLAGELTPIAWGPEQEPVGYVDAQRQIYGMQFLLERNDPDGMTLLLNFVRDICHCTAWWTLEAIQERCVEEIRSLSEDGTVLCLVSGGLDSAVSARLTQLAVGGRAVCVLVDTGLMREGEIAEVQRMFREELEMDVRYLDARRETLEALQGVSESREKTQVVGGIYEQVIARYAQEIGGVSLLTQGTNYSDLVHRGVLEEEPGLRSCGRYRIVEPLRELFKDEVRRLGQALAMPERLLARQAFPGAGLALRLTGPISEERIARLRRADAIVRDEIIKSGQERKLSQYFALMMPMPTGLHAGDIIVVRAVQPGAQGVYAARLPYDLLERVTQRVREEMPEVLRVLYDVTDGRQSKAEWL